MLRKFLDKDFSAALNLLNGKRDMWFDLRNQYGEMRDIALFTQLCHDNKTITVSDKTMLKLNIQNVSVMIPHEQKVNLNCIFV